MTLHATNARGRIARAGICLALFAAVCALLPAHTVHAAGINANGATLGVLTADYWSFTMQGNPADARVVAAGTFDQGGRQTNPNGAELAINPLDAFDTLTGGGQTIEVAITGVLTDASTLTPIACAVVELTSEGGEFVLTAVTDDNGEYFFEPQDAGLYTVRVLAPGFATLAPEPITLDGFEYSAMPVVRNFSLTPAPTPNTVTGRVTDEDTGFALVGVRVRVFLDGEPDVPFAITFTCADGRYELPLPGAPGDIEIELRFNLPNFFPVDRDDTVDPSVGVIVDETLKARFDGPSAIIGSVREDGTDTPLPGARIILRGPINTATETDGDGAYSFDAVLEGSYSVTASVSGFKGQSRQRVVPPGGVGEASFSLEPIASAGIPGDVNGDGEVNAIDVQLAINAALGIAIDPSFNADINGDSAVNAIDVQLAINAALGLDISGQIP